MQKKTSQRTLNTKTGKLFFSKLTTPGISFAAALRSKTEEQQQPQTHQVAGLATMEPRVAVALPHQEQQKKGQSIWAPNVMQQIMTANNTVLEEAKILAITKIVLNLMEQNGH
jgi:hypothetical protein